MTDRVRHGTLNLLFWLGGAVYQQVSGLILSAFPQLNGHTPVTAYHAVFCFYLGPVGLSIVLTPFASADVRSGRPGFSQFSRASSLSAVRLDS
jgi:hypothetical protein